MSRSFALLFSLVLISPLSWSGTAIENEIAAVEALNSKCRGGSGDISDTHKICAQRDKAYAALEAKGWCYGHDGQAGYERKWELCKSKLELVSLFITFKAKEGDVLPIRQITLVAYPERPCHLDDLPNYRAMRLATMSTVPVCYAKRGDQIIVFDPVSGPDAFPDGLFVVGHYDEKAGTVKIIQPGFDSDKAVELYTKREQEKVMRRQPGAPLPPRDKR